MQAPKTSPLPIRAAIGLLFVLMLVHAALAIAYASQTPWRTGGMVFLSRSPVQDIGAPDERQHVNYVARLANGEGFPVFNPKDPHLYETYQSHQPPTYYLLAAGWSKLLGIDLSDSGISEPGNGQRLRMLNAVIGATTVAGVFFLILWGFGRPDYALAGALFAALLPMSVALSSAVSNDPLLISLCTWALALAARGVKNGWTWKLVAALGVVTGVALVTKTTAVALLPALLVAALVPQKTRPSLAKVGTVLSIALLVSGGWFARNQSLYGDPLAIGAFNQAFTGSMQKATIVGNLAKHGDASPDLTYWKDAVGWWTARSFVGVFGYMDIWMNESGIADNPDDKNTLYRLALVFFGILALAWLLASFKPELRKDWAVQAVNGVFLAVIVVLFLRFNNQYFQAQARYLLPAIGPIAAAMGIGAVYASKQRWPAAFAVLGLVLLGINLYALSMLPAQFKLRTDAPVQAGHS